MSWPVLLETLLLGLAGDRPGGLLLTVLTFAAAAAGGLLLATIYAALCVASPAFSWPLMAVSVLLRSVPPIMLVFALAHAPGMSIATAGLLGLVLYSFSHVGETLRAYLAAYPPVLSDSARVAGVHPAFDWCVLRLGWCLRRGLPALATHWVSLLKDTGILVVIGIGELTTTAKLIAESSASLGAWITVLATAGGLYCGAACLFLAAIARLQHAIDPAARAVARLSTSSGLSPTSCCGTR